jgi:ribonuclease HI
MTTLKVYTDGGARGNPGPAAVGVVIYNQRGEKWLSFGRVIGKATNNVAEYQAVIMALEELSKLGIVEPVNFFLDSKLVVEQLRGRWKIKHEPLRRLAERVHQLEAGLPPITYTAISREQNRPADTLVNRALDKC